MVCTCICMSAGMLVSRVTNDSSYSATNVGPPTIPFHYGFSSIPRSANSFEFGLGAQYRVGSNWSLRAEWQRSNMNAYRMSFTLMPNGVVVMRVKNKRASDLAGMLYKKGRKPVPVEQLSR